MLRGNHESRSLTKSFQFKEECIAKYNDDFYHECMFAFDALPLAAVISNKYLCCHGGLSPDILHLKDINKIDRFHEPPETGPFCDLLWADPCNKFFEENEEENEWFLVNDKRGCSHTFGSEAVKKFLEENKLDFIIRAHEVQFDGYKVQDTEDFHFMLVYFSFSAQGY